jgi:hypothetical protein
MPAGFNTGPLVNSDAAVNSVAVAKSSGSSFSNLKNPKLIIITVVGLVVIGVSGYFIYRHFSKPTEQPAPVADQQTNDTQANQDNTNQEESTTPPPYTTPAEWQSKFFGSETCLQLSICGDDADADHDGLSNLDEFNLGSDPNNADSDSDGLADGDELHVFGSNPLKIRTAEDAKFTDTDYAKGGYDVTTKQKFTSEKLFVDNIPFLDDEYYKKYHKTIKIKEIDYPKLLSSEFNFPRTTEEIVELQYDYNNFDWIFERYSNVRLRAQ